jgi:hypothetical protein
MAASAFARVSIFVLLSDPRAGRIGTIGYLGMHQYERESYSPSICGRWLEYVK